MSGAGSVASPVDVGRGFADPVHGAQQTFRALLEAMARPGRVQALPEIARAGIQPPGCGVALAAVLLCLLDAEVHAWFGAGADGPAAIDYLRFHAGVRRAPRAEVADFVIADGTHATADWWRTLRRGSDTQPQDGATLVLAARALASGDAGAGIALDLRGPGIAARQWLTVDGPTRAFWQARAAATADLPLGIDLLLCCDDTLAAVPRTTRVTVREA